MEAMEDDCPSHKPKWMYSTDFPRYDPSKDVHSHRAPTGDFLKQIASNVVMNPLNWEKFSDAESSFLENAYLGCRRHHPTATASDPKEIHSEGSVSTRDVHSQQGMDPTEFLIPVGEGKLHEVDVEHMVRYAIYWPSPIHEVRRAFWFAPLGPAGKWVPCDPVLERQIEEGFWRTKPWLQASSPAGKVSPTSLTDDKKELKSDASYMAKARTPSFPSLSPNLELLESMPRQPLFGPYLGKYCMYDPDGHTCYLRDDSTVAKLQQTVLAVMGAVGAAAGLRLIRGYDNIPAAVKEKDAKDPSQTKSNSNSDSDILASHSTENRSRSPVQGTVQSNFRFDHVEEPEATMARVPHHLVLVVHGIGAKLSEKMESVSFVYDVELLRNGMYQALPQHLQGIPGPVEAKSPSIAVLPIQWRQNIRFATEPTKLQEEADSDEDDLSCTDGDEYHGSLKLHGSLTALTSSKADFEVALSQKDLNAAKKCSSPTKLDIITPNSKSNASSTSTSPVVGQCNSKQEISKDLENDEHLPALDEIVLPGVPAIRTLVSDVVLDVLLYMTPRYRSEIIRNVTQEMNRVYALFMSRNPTFDGKVSIIGHSLGSVIALEILSIDKQDPNFVTDEIQSPWRVPHVERYLQCLNLCGHQHVINLTVRSNQEYHEYFHPMIKAMPLVLPTPLRFEVDNFFLLGSPVGYFLLLQGEKLRAFDAADKKRKKTVKSPVCTNFFNIFSVYDPVAVRLEPLVRRSNTVNAPMRVPYHKGGLKGIQVGVETATAKAIGAFRQSSGYLSSIWKTSIGMAISRVPGNLESQDKSVDIPLQEEVVLSKSALELRALNPRHHRVDFALQQGILENPYLAALSTHMAYWGDYDIAYV
jgi:hypothetical protein